MPNKNKWNVDRTLHSHFTIYGKDLATIADCFDNEANANLIVAAINACIKINPDNPLAVAKSIEDMHTSIKATSGFLKALRKLDPKLFNDCRVTILDTTIEQTLAKINNDGLFNPDIPNPSDDV